MKLLSALLYFAILLSSPSNQDELHAVEATYDGQSGGVFYFVDMEGSSYTFNEIEPRAREKYDLTDGSCDGKEFIVVYRIIYNVEKGQEQEESEKPEEGQEIVEKEDNGDEEFEEYDYGTCIIVDLELVG